MQSRANFNKIVQWLRDFEFPVEIPSNTELYAKVFPPWKQHPGAFAYIGFGKETNDSLSIGTDIELKGEYKNAVDALKPLAQDQIFMDIRKLVYPLGINLDNRYPTISLHKLIFFESLR